MIDTSLMLLSSIFYSKLLLLNIIEKKFMANKDFLVIKLDKHPTKDILDDHVNGSLTVIWRDWDKIISYEPRMVYVSSVFPGQVKEICQELKIIKIINL